MWADYSIESTLSSFRLRAANRSTDSKFTCILNGMSTLCNAKDTVINIGNYRDPNPATSRWYNGTSFVLSGVDGAWVSSVSSGIGPWMSKSLNYIGDRNLRHICMPGSHNSGMSVVTGRTRIVRDWDIVTQHRSVKDQLGLGVRFFDIRPTQWNGKLSTLR